MIDFSDPTIVLVSAPWPAVMICVAIGVWFIWHGMWHRRG